MLENETKQYVIYSRKSKFTGKGESIGNQIEMCRNYIAAHFGETAAKQTMVFEDEGFSGGNLERPQFQKMLKASRKIKFTAIVVYRLDRISRNIGDFAKLIEDLGERGIGFVSIREQFDTASPMGRAMMYIASVFAQLERETIAERIRDNMHELSKSGRWLGGTTPTGYASEAITMVAVDGKRKKSCRLKEIPEELRLIELIFDTFLETGSLSQTERFLQHQGYRTRKGNPFTRFAVRGILSNPVYMIADEDAYGYLEEKKVDLFSERQAFDGDRGIMAYNRTLQRPGKAHRVKPMEQWIVSVGEHKGVITGEKWIQVQHLLDINRSGEYRKPRGQVALLSGLLVCQKCGGHMRPKGTNRINAKGDPVYTYLCSVKERSHGCECSVKNANGNELDAKLMAQLGQLEADRADMLRQLAQGKRVMKRSCEGQEAEAAGIKAEIASAEADIQELISVLPKTSGTAAELHVMERIEELHRHEKELKRRLENLAELSPGQSLDAGSFAALSGELYSLQEQLAVMTVVQKRNALRSVIKKIVWDGENAYVYFLAEETDHNA